MSLFLLLAALAAVLVVASMATGSNSYDTVPNAKYMTGTPRAGAVVAATGNSSKRHVRGAKNLMIHWYAVNTAGTSPTLDGKLQHSADGVTWLDAGVAFAQATGALATKSESKTLVGDILPWVRIAYTIGGTASPSYTVRAWISYDVCRGSPPMSPLATE